MHSVYTGSITGDVSIYSVITHSAKVTRQQKECRERGVEPLPHFLPSAPPKSANSFLGNLSPLYWFFVNPPIKSRTFQWSPKISFSSLKLSYLLKVTKFLVKISYFEFLVMTEKNIFAYKLFVIEYFKF